MPLSAHAQRLAEIVRSLAPFFKEQGFRKRRHTFNREREDTIQVVNFQMAPYEPVPPNFTELERKRFERYRRRVFGPSLCGLFAVNLGVFLHQLHDIPRWVQSGDPEIVERRRFVNEYECAIRDRLQSAEGGEWWPLERDAGWVSHDVQARLMSHAMPWFERFPSSQALIDDFDQGQLPPFFTGAPRLYMALLLAAHGDRERAEALLNLHYIDSWQHRGHQEYISEVASALGFELSI